MANYEAELFFIMVALCFIARYLRRIALYFENKESKK